MVLLAALSPRLLSVSSILLGPLELDLPLLDAVELPGAFEATPGSGGAAVDPAAPESGAAAAGAAAAAAAAAAHAAYLAFVSLTFWRSWASDRSSAAIPFAASKANLTAQIWQ